MRFHMSQKDSQHCADYARGRIHAAGFLGARLGLCGCALTWQLVGQCSQQHNTASLHWNPRTTKRQSSSFMSRYTVLYKPGVFSIWLHKHTCELVVC